MDVPHLLRLPLLSVALAATSVVTVDNTSPAVVFSPTPCFQQDSPDCSAEWQLRESTDAFNGSSTSTTGVDPALRLDILPRVSLTFQGTDVLFMPGHHSTAQAGVVVDDLASILLDTSKDAFAGNGLDPAQNHTITITFIPSAHSTTLNVDYFLIVRPANTTTSPSSTFFPTPLPTMLPSTTTAATTAATAAATAAPAAPAASPTAAPQPTGIPSGTIAAVSLSGALLLLLAAVLLLYAARRRRRRAALQREKAILGDLRLPSERPAPRPPKPASHDRLWQERHFAELGPREKGKAREPGWRTSVLQPVHYTPWR